MEDYSRIKLNDGRWIPTISFGTGTSYFNRIDDVCEGLVKAIGLSNFNKRQIQEVNYTTEKR